MRFFSRVSIPLLGAWALLGAPLPALADDAFVENSIWSLPGTDAETRWVEIHNVEGSGTAALLHVTVLSLKKGSPSWSATRVTPHLAITDAALRRSVTKPSPHRRAVYPEAYEEGYERWRALRANGDAPICETSVADCTHNYRLERP